MNSTVRQPLHVLECSSRFKPLHVTSIHTWKLKFFYKNFEIKLILEVLCGFTIHHAQLPVQTLLIVDNIEGVLPSQSGEKYARDSSEIFDIANETSKLDGLASERIFSHLSLIAAK